MHTQSKYYTGCVKSYPVLDVPGEPPNNYVKLYQTGVGLKCYLTVV